MKHVILFVTTHECDAPDLNTSPYAITDERTLPWR